MTKNLRLPDLKRGEQGVFVGFSIENSSLVENLEKKGFVKDTVVKRANIGLNDPIVFIIRGARISLRKKDAHNILIKV